MISVRDYFAGKAMAVIMTMPISAEGEETIAHLAYEMADAMMKARGDLAHKQEGSLAEFDRYIAGDR